MTAHFINLIDAVNTLPKARKVMAFSKRDVFSIRTVRRLSDNEPRFVIAMYSGNALARGLAANDAFAGYY